MDKKTLGAISVIQRWQGCKRKIASSESGAKRRAKNQRQRGNPSHHYKCQYCEFWHIASGVKG